MFNAFIKFGDIKGDCTDKDHADQCVITAFRHSIRQPASLLQNMSGGRTAEAVEFSEFEIDKFHDGATPKLYEAACKGTHIPEIDIELVKAGGDPVPYEKIKLKNALISGVYHNGDPSSQHQFPVETVKMTFEAIEWTFTKQTKTGSKGGNIAMKWSVIQGAAA